MLIELLIFGVCAKVRPVLTLALNPSLAFLCKTMFMIPDIPSGLYLALGLVINSIFLIEVDGICFNNCEASILLGRPSTKTRTFSFPRKDIFPS